MATVPGTFDGDTRRFEGEVTFENLVVRTPPSLRYPSDLHPQLALVWYAPRHLVHLAILVCALAGCVILYAITLAWWQLCWWQSLLLLRTAELMKKAYADDEGVTAQEFTTELPSKVTARTDTRTAVPEAQPKTTDASRLVHGLSATSAQQSNGEALPNSVAASSDADAVAAYELACEVWEPDFDDDDDYWTSEHVQTSKLRDPEADQGSQAESQPSRYTLAHQKSFDQLLEGQSEEAVRAAAQSAWVQKLRIGVDPSAMRTTTTVSASRQRAKVSSVVVKELKQQHPSPVVDHADDPDHVDSVRTITTRPLATSNLNDSDADRRARQLALLECRVFLQTATKPGQKVRPPYDESLTHDSRSSASTIPNARTTLPKMPGTPARGRPSFAPAPKGHKGPWATVAARPLKQPSPRALEVAKIQAQSRVPPPPGFIPPHTRAANAAKAARIQLLQAQKTAHAPSNEGATMPASVQVDSNKRTIEVPIGQADTKSTTPAENPSSQPMDVSFPVSRDELCSTPECDAVGSRTLPTWVPLDDSPISSSPVHPMLPLDTSASDSVVRFSIDELKSCSPPKASGGVSCSRCDHLTTHLVQMVEKDRQPLCFPCFTVDDRIDDAVDVITGNEDILGSWETVPSDLKGFSIARKKAHSNASTVQKSAVPSALKRIISHAHRTSPVLRATTPTSVEETTSSEWQVAASRQRKVRNKNIAAPVDLANPVGDKSEHVDPVGRSPALDFKVEEAAEINGVPQGSASKQDNRSMSCTSNGSASASSTMSASALPFASFSRARETSPMSRNFWVPPAPNTLQTAARLALSPPLQLQQLQSVQAIGPVPPPQPCPQLERQIALFGQNISAHQPAQLPLGQPVMPTFGFGPPHTSGMLFHISPPAHRVPLFAPPGLASVPAYGHADLAELGVYDGHMPAAPPHGFPHDRYHTHSAHATFQTSPMPTPLPIPTPQSQRKDSSRSVSKAVPIVKPPRTTQPEREPTAADAPEAATDSVLSEQQIEALKMLSHHDEDLAMSRPSAAVVPASQPETNETLTEPTVLGMVNQSTHRAGLEKSGLAFASDTIATALADADIVATECTSPVMDEQDVVEDVTTAIPANKPARNRRKAIREALTAAWFARETFRVKVNGAYSLDRAQAFTTATKEYNAKRKELAASMASGELNEEDAITFPFLSPKDMTVPKVRPKALTVSATTTAPTANVAHQPASKENDPAPHPSCVDPTCTTCSEPLYKIALTKAIHALETLIKARRMSSQR
ncbi:hypothetical protein LTR95_015857, partial [Oleoguttula sp. CCFEE 5521]